MSNPNTPQLPVPPKQVLDDKTPDGIREDMAVATWREGWLDGREGNDYRMFEKHDELQPLYSHGFEVGEQERSIIGELLSTRQESPEQIILKKIKEIQGPKPPSHIRAINRGMKFCEDNRFAFQGFCYLTVGMLAAQILVRNAVR